jgi:enoyl-CoA hydratase/carnithine racemase
VGYQRAAELLLLGEPLSASSAFAAGLVNRVLAPEEVNTFAQAVATKLADKPRRPLIAAKRLMKASRMERVLQRMDEEWSVFWQLVNEPAAIEAFNAFAERRTPRHSHL